MKKIMIYSCMVLFLLILTSCNLQNTGEVEDNTNDAQKIISASQFIEPENMNLIEKTRIETTEYLGRDLEIYLYANAITSKEEQIDNGGTTWTMLVKDGDKSFALLDNAYIKDELVEYYPVVNLENNEFFIALEQRHSSVGISISEYRYNEENKTFSEYSVYKFPGNPNILNKVK